MENVVSWTSGLPSITKVQIFSHLPLRDRETVRLVCKDWYTASWSRKLITDDWVKLDSDQYLDATTKMNQICDVFDSSSTLGGKLCSFEIAVPRRSHRSTARFWTVFGPHIVRLRLRNCSHIDAAMLQLILESCTALRTLDFDSSLVPLAASISETSIATIRDNLRGVRELSVTGDFGVLNNLLPKGKQISFHYSYTAPVQAETVSAFFADHQVKQVSLKADCSGIDTNALDEAAEQLENILLISRPALTALDLTFTGNNLNVAAMMQRVFKNVPLLNDTLTHLGLKLYTYVADIKPTLNRIIRGISSLTHLKTCKLVLPPTIMMQLVHTVLSNNPSLKMLNMVASDGLLFTNSDDASMWNGPGSKLLDACDTTPSRNNDCATALSRSNDQTTSPSLKAVSIESHRVTGFLVVSGHLSALGKSLTHLRLWGNRDLDDAALQQICKECTGLRTLQVQNCGGVTDAGLTGKPNLLAAAGQADCEHYGLSNLQQLETLHLIGDFYPKTVAEIRFPRLRSLSLSIGDLTDANLLAIARNNPRLNSFYTTHRHDLEQDLLSWAGVVRFLENAPLLASLTVGDPDDHSTYYRFEGEMKEQYFTDQQMRTVHRRFPHLKRFNKNRLVGI